jgi:hypothetical protein
MGDLDAKVRLTDATKNAFQGFTERLELLAGGCGYSIEALWRMTPRQIVGLVRLLEKRAERAANS